MIAPPGVLRVPGFARLWAAGGIGSAILWLEVLAAGLFTFQATGSGLAVAMVSAARSLPALASGALIGVLAETVNRKRIVQGGLLLAATSSGSVSLLGFWGLARPWHLGVAALASGLVYATEYPARRRMIAEIAGPGRVRNAVALDSLTNFATRCAGPLAGGAAYGAFGLGGTFAASATLSLLGAILVAGVPHVQERRFLAFADVRRDLAEGFAFVRGTAALRTLLGVTVVMNLFGYSYTVLMPPIGRQAFFLSPALVGVLAASEPAGAFLGGLVMTLMALPGRPLGWLAGGAALLMSALATVPLLPPLLPVCLILLLGGVGSGIYTNHQTTIAIAATPPALRSRVFGLLTVCIGCWPLGQLFVGALTLRLSPLGALTTLGLVGLGALLATIVATTRASRKLGERAN